MFILLTMTSDKPKVLYRITFGFKNQRETFWSLVEVFIFLDLKKAFDTVDHNILKKKLKIKGISGLSYDLISSYLANRYQFTCVNSQKSDKNIINYGVSQDSILGLFYFFYILMTYLNHQT